MDINAYPKGCFASFKRHTNTKRTSFAMKLLSGAVSVAIGALGVSGQVSAFPDTNQFKEQDGVWTLGTNSGFQVTTGGTNEKPVYSLLSTKDPYDNSYAWLWSYSDSDSPAPSSISVVLSQTQGWNSKTDGKFVDHTDTTMWLAGGLVSLFSDGSKASKQEVAAATSIADTGIGSRTPNGNMLSVTLEKDVSFMGKFFGARNDLGGGLTASIDSTLATLGETNNNTVRFDLAEKSRLYSKVTYGGRSAQLDSILGSTVTVNTEKGNVTTTAIHKGFKTNNNKVFIQGTISGPTAEKNANAIEVGKPGDSSLLISKGIFGGEGYESSGNLVSIKDTLLVAGYSGARKLGLVGGRGMHFWRINQVDLGTRINNSLVWDNEKLAEHSSIANNNIVTINNSYIGYKTANDWNTGSTLADFSYAIYGGWSTGIAANNIVSIKDSVINGNVYGGLELQDRLTASGSDLRPLNANLVSLFNVKFEDGSAVYGTATAEGKFKEEDGVTVLDQSSLKAVNRRRGVVYLTGENEVDAVYARYVHFGQYVDNSVLEANPKVDREIVRDYYPSSSNYDKVLSDPNYEVKDSLGLNRVTSNSEASQYAMQLGDLVAKSYVVNKTGFHSTLTSHDSANVSNVTNGMHNFWVGAYVNLVSKVDGDGKLFNKDSQNLFKDKKTYTVNHNYGDGATSADQNLSLLVHDDGMVYNFKPTTVTGGAQDQNVTHRPSLMHQFRYHYDGLVLYVGVNPGVDSTGNAIHAVEISFEEIEKFRKGEGVNAFGNTFVGVFLEGNSRPFFLDSTSDGLKTVDAKLMTFDPIKENGRPGFDIYQNGQVVAEATYGIYKYLHFDGEDRKISDKDQNGNPLEYTGKVTSAGESGGIGIKYWLKSLNILDNKMLTLNGVTENTDIGTTVSIDPQERYTLSAELTGNGGVVIPENNIVVLGTPKTIYNIKVKDYGDNDEVEFNSALPNSYTGVTLIESDALLAAGIDGALGSDSSHTSALQLLEGKNGKTAFYLQGHQQVIGSLTVEENALLSLTEDAVIKVTSTDGKAYTANRGSTDGELTIRKGGVVAGNIKGETKSIINVEGYSLDISSANPDFLGTVYLKDGASGLLNNQNALEAAAANVGKDSSLYFLTSPTPATTKAVGNTTATIRAITNSGQVYLSNADLEQKLDTLNVVNVKNAYEGSAGSVIHYRGLVQGPNNSQVDVVHSQTATGTSEITFGDHKDLPPVGVFAQSQGEKTLKENGIPVFIVQKPTHDANDLTLTMQEFGVKAKDNEAYKWMYGLGYNEKEDGSREWVLYNSNTPDDEPTPIIPPSPSVDPDLPNIPVLRPESGAYIANSEAWAKMHMRLHDRFGQAYYIDPFDGEEKKASGWVRQVGTHSHFKAGSSKTHARTAITQVGADLIRNEANEDWKYVGGVFAGGLYNRANTRSWDSAKSRSDGYSLGIYGTIYTGNSPDDGFYVDSWLLFGRYDNKVWGDENPGFKYKSRGWVWSVESGYTIPLSESGTKDYNKLIWTFQPEVQVVWDGVRASSVVDNTGTKYTQLGKDNVSIRVGARLHANYMNKGLGFIEGNWIHNTKSPGVRMTNGDIYRNGGRNVGEFRMGLEGHLSRNTLGWATVGVQAGKSGYHNETAQIGLRYMF